MGSFAKATLRVLPDLSVFALGASERSIFSFIINLNLPPMISSKSGASLSSRSLSRNQTSRDQSLAADAMEYTPSLQSQYSYEHSEIKKGDCKANIEHLLQMTNTAQFAGPPTKVDS